ncbi:helix-turn-helix transcriptional regulator [Flavobacterium sp. MAH-1]|uniref:Helix-turn-helix transcriptional regulator n=1 Tax=Flavobacterium agri TaxID=2743471 RepID=A0A7Y8XYM3_9FLAO|nr:AraC family transcriptional regulator [Flavobacterium agri]NUY79332.1 helix-turn-helix transcriptional regulator [Flavobacterium agri]NYA69356.1 helix-turn-helix transcriptional regulator [Flavobacterium agri]
MQLHIKNMVCDRCIMVVESTFKTQGLSVISVDLGQVEIAEELSDARKKSLDDALREFGFELIDDRKTQTVEKIKNLILELVHQRDNDLKINLSDYLVSKMNQDYSSMSNLFSQHTSVTIEQFYILQKIERVKELLQDGQSNLNEIAEHLNYSSASHLTRQFKKVTGLTPTEFRNSHPALRTPLNRL